jgi:hypothetical protein
LGRADHHYSANARALRRRGHRRRKRDDSQLAITVTLSHPSSQTVTAQWNTAFINGASNVQATPSTDYTPASGTVTFPPGATTETVPITAVNHDLGMPYKLLVVSFHNPINANPGGYYGLAFGFLINNTG